MVIEPYCQQYPIIKAQKKRYSSNAVRAQHVINVPQYLSFSVVIGQLLKWPTPFKESSNAIFCQYSR